MLPAHLIDEFWGTVKQDLQDRHHLSDDKATRGIACYRSAIDRHQVGELVYHREPKAIAETIAVGVKNNYEFADPSISAGRLAG